MRCEKFLNKLQTDDNNDELESNDEDGNEYKNKEDDEDYGLLSG